MENSVWHGAYFCVNFVWALATFLSVFVICCCICLSLWIYFRYKYKESKNISDREKDEFNKRFEYEKDLNKNQSTLKNEELQRTLQIKLADAIIEKVKNCDVDLDNAISKVDILKEKLFVKDISEQH